MSSPLTARFVHHDEFTGLTFAWEGGAYIDVFAGHPDDLTEDTAPFDTINVWDYTMGSSVIPETYEALVQEVNEWIQDNA